MADSEESIEEMELRLHKLDAELAELRDRIIYIKRGVYPISNPEAELDRLEARYLELGEAFNRLYNEWRRRSAE